MNASKEEKYCDVFNNIFLSQKHVTFPNILIFYTFVYSLDISKCDEIKHVVEH